MQSINTRRVPENDNIFVALWHQYGSATAVAKVLGISVRRAMNIRRDIEGRRGIVLKSTNYSRTPADALVNGKTDTPDRANLQTFEAEIRARLRTEFEDRLRQLSDRAHKAERRALEAMREDDRSEELRAAVFGLRQTQIDPPRWTVPTTRSESGKVLTVPLLMFSDPQVGEVIAPSEMDGINGYDMQVFADRYRTLIERTIEISTRHMGGHHTYPGIVYWRGGDMVSGEIHDELTETNDLHSIPAVKHLVEQEVAGLKELAAAFGRVHVVSVPGNHGRTTRKPHAKRFAETNYDTLSAWWLESLLTGDARFTWQTPKSGDAIVPIAGHTWLLTHGDRIGSRGGEGFIGPAATIARGMKRTRDYYARLGTIIDYVGIGHFHTRLENEFGFANGSVPGVSEYAKSGRMTPSEPSQWLLFNHLDHGVTARWPIMLAKRPRIEAGEIRKAA